ncbi:plastocyanin/azurin family copper-binding protein [Pandoraea sp.]|uniref:plastocyanin/azurin family copper-binding protein n=1 Tax=Pandoraea sp. TaxID=1883445 RepID=UPI0025DF82B5|nr:plastocyanin/azurin family copper-binding protein [Pandoraea sp.]
MRRSSMMCHPLIAVALALAATAAVASEPPSVTVKLTNQNNGKMSLTLSRTTVPAGPVEFTIENLSPDMKHEFMIEPWKGSPKALPYDAKAQQVEEDKLTKMVGVEDLNPHETVTARFVLKPGRYVAFCNEPGHYKENMVATLTVK